MHTSIFSLVSTRDPTLLKRGGREAESFCRDLIRYPLFLLKLLLAMVLSACASAPTASKKGSYVVTAPRTSFYRVSPLQPNGPDEVLPQGERVTMLKREFGYSQVSNAAGRSGFVATDDLAPAPPEPKLAVASKRSYATALTRHLPSPAARTRASSSDGLFDVFDVPLPAADEPPKPARPRFR
jgi:hypothetical protein